MGINEIVNKEKTKSIPKNKLVKNEVERLKKIKSNKNKNTDKLIHLAAESLKIKYEAAKRNYYYRLFKNTPTSPKKLQK